METTHRVFIGDSRRLDRVPDDSVELVVTSPPYPMIEMWDDLFCALDPSIEEALAAGEGARAFDSMHAALDEVWTEVARVLVDGGIACLNVGDATRRLGDHFRVYRNHDRIARAFEERGFDPLPDVLWRKPVNSATKFMGSGMLPPNAYVTLEHEFVLVFRNGRESRSFAPGADERYRAAYFWEERNRWFSDVWTDVAGEHQTLAHDDLRERSGAFPFALPYRLVNMYSVYGDTVFDPFWGTGTTTLAAMVAGRHSVGSELEADFLDVFADRVESVPGVAQDVLTRRLDDHDAFVERRRAAGNPPAYDAEAYDTRVVTKQERRLQFYGVSGVESVTTEGASSSSACGDICYRVEHEPFERSPDRNDSSQPNN